MDELGLEEAARSSASRRSPRESSGFRRNFVRENGVNDPSRESQSVADRRSLRARYRAVKLDIAEGKEAFTRLDSDRFDHVFRNVEHLHDEVSRPREQIADAEALLDITASFLASVKDVKRGGGLTPSEFVNGIIRNYDTVMVRAEERLERMIDWRRLGLEATAVFSDAPGMITMLGPMDCQPKQRKVAQRKQRDRPVEGVRPEELEDSTDNCRTETDKNMETMFMILKRLKSVSLEVLVLNRNSFSQTVENIFALSFLVKDGRAKISIENGQHVVAPKNFPSQQQRERGEGSMSQFVFRFDFKDWKVMQDMVEEGTELMPHRESVLSSNGRGGSRTPVRKYCRNRAKETPANDDADRIDAKVGIEDEHQPHLRKKMRAVVGSL